MVHQIQEDSFNVVYDDGNTDTVTSESVKPISEGSQTYVHENRVFNDIYKMLALMKTPLHCLSTSSQNPSWTPAFVWAAP